MTVNRIKIETVLSIIPAVFFFNLQPLQCDTIPKIRDKTPKIIIYIAIAITAVLFILVSDKVVATGKEYTQAIMPKTKLATANPLPFFF